jgi:hypothetical protein
MGLRPHFAEWLASDGLKEVKRRLELAATSVDGSGIEGVIVFTLPGFGQWRAIDCDLTGIVRGLRHEDTQHEVSVTAEAWNDGIEWKVVR